MSKLEERTEKSNATRKRNKTAVFEEFGTTGTRQHLTASGRGILMRAVHVDRNLGVLQARQQAKMLTAAADYAEAAGCADSLMEPS